MISEFLLSLLVYLAVGVTIISPIILTWLVVRDWRSGKLW